MNENSYLNPEAIRVQCDAAISQLEKDNEAFRREEKSIQAFIDDGRIKSEAFDALKQQMNDYVTALQTMRLANETDISDFRFLKMAVGGLELKGELILGEKESARKEKIRNEEKAELYRKKARRAETNLLRLNYKTKVEHYEAMAEIEQRFYDAWQEKEDQYDAVEKFTSGLFEEGQSIRAIAEDALTSVQGAFYDGAYHPDMNAGWRTDIHNVYFNRVFTVSENGEITIDIKEVEKILKKDAGEITAEEYDVIALAYLLAEDEDLAVFMQCMMKDRHDYHFEILWDEKRDFSEWNVDHEKLEQMIGRIEKASFEKLSLLQETRASGDNIKVLEYEGQRDALLQRLTLLHVINQCISFDGEYQADYPKFTIKKNKDGDLVVEFLEHKTADEYGQINKLLESAITVSNTVNGRSIDEKMIDNVKYLFDCRFGQYTLEDYIADKAEGRIMKHVVDSIPGKGIIAGIGMDFWKGQQQAQKNHKFIEEQFDTLSAGYIYGNYDCSANFVDYDMKYEKENEHKIFVYEGEKTREKINTLNNGKNSKNDTLKQLAESIKEEFPPDGLTVETVLTRPEEVYQFGDGLTGDMEKLYEHIVENKINEMGEMK